jgi:hypothetical protein
MRHSFTLSKHISLKSILILFQRNRVEGYGLNSFGSGKELVAGCCKHTNEP